MTLHNGIAKFQQKVLTFLSWNQRSRNSDPNYKVKKNIKIKGKREQSKKLQKFDSKEKNVS